MTMTTGGHSRPATGENRPSLCYEFCYRLAILLRQGGNRSTFGRHRAEIDKGLIPRAIRKAHAAVLVPGPRPRHRLLPA